MATAASMQSNARFRACKAPSRLVRSGLAHGLILPSVTYQDITAAIIAPTNGLDVHATAQKKPSHGVWDRKKALHTFVSPSKTIDAFFSRTTLALPDEGKIRFLCLYPMVTNQFSASELDESAMRSSLTSRFITPNETIGNHCEKEETTGGRPNKSSLSTRVSSTASSGAEMLDSDGIDNRWPRTMLSV
ncbi:hypothetical protein BDP55DRAFT_629683 [Colletotrichum godetiae]|uniref:Uncharacterized protein n=1 Tax=Colletotrichum godetiae TaxID=1209918 RepID=A0AAJ0EYF4_9PEZI|nr:uncharacterized protein BDP55DRAFT_629683 [Colletotrichum godetiae]KAK1688586.1 hypothetical protein BDP55DRAFT_629683 [Colletotrichum godetiae]